MGASCSGTVRTFPDAGDLDFYAAPEALSKPDSAFIRGSLKERAAGEESSSGRRRRASARRDAASDGCQGRRISSFNATAIPASPSLRRKSAVPMVGSDSSSAYSSPCSSTSGSSRSLNSGGPFQEPGMGSSPRKGCRISWCEVKEVSTFSIKI